MHAPVAPEINRLIDLIDYVEATERDKLKTVLDYQDHKAFRKTGAELQGLPGVALDVGRDDDPIWLRVDRLPKKAPPAPEDAELSVWLTYRDDPKSEPRLKSEVAGAVAPIIEFSKAQFYNHRLNPLRLPTASERLDPPLIDVRIEDGYRQGDINPPEAAYIVEEIERITSDPMMAKRTIGVTTLLGQKQAAHIYSLIEQKLGPEVIEQHHLRVGDPTAFQGDERDIMFISLVAQTGDSALSGVRFEQRFNVALSRACDRTYLVRSIDVEALRHSDQLRRALLDHFRMPFPSDGQEAKDRREKCESDFEREMYDLLVERGYRVDTQVKVGDFRIDLVVEGENDRRVAIECDGDRYHGPDRWAADMTRVNATREELRYARNYQPGMMLEVASRQSRHRLGRGSHEIAAVDTEKGVVTLRDERGHLRRFVPARLSAKGSDQTLQLFEKKDLDLYTGDAIRWTASDHQRGMINADRATVTAIDQDGVTVTSSSGMEHKLKPNDPMLKRIDLAYALNAHMAQGLTADKGIAVLGSRERRLLSQRNFLVTITRLRDELTLIVDNRDKVGRGIATNLGEKTSAAEITERLGISAAKGLRLGQIQATNSDRQAEPEKAPELAKERVKPFDIGL